MLRAVRYVVVCVAAMSGACGFTPNRLGDNTTDGNAGSDAAIDTPDNVVCFGSSPIDKVCLPKPLDTTPLTYSVAHAIDTDGGECIAVKANGIDVCVIAAPSITIADLVTVTAHGSKPLVMVATATDGAITFAGVQSVLDVGSHRDGSSGPGPGRQSGSSPACTANATPAGGHGGGYGGSFTRTGGGGGVDNTGANAGGPANAQSLPTTLVGGCPGGVGGGNPLAVAEGGGAIALIAPTIMLTGALTASGAGGFGTTPGLGGMGGGAGGLIVLDFTTLDGIGLVLAQGGGGGEGSGGNPGFYGFDGFDAVNRSFDCAGGADNSPSGGNGGDGGSRSMVGAGKSATQGGSGAGGGGGGGAAGAFIILGPTSGTQVDFYPNLT